MDLEIKTHLGLILVAFTIRFCQQHHHWTCHFILSSIETLIGLAADKNADTSTAPLETHSVLPRLNSPDKLYKGKLLCVKELWTLLLSAKAQLGMTVLLIWLQTSCFGLTWSRPTIIFKLYFIFNTRMTQRKWSLLAKVAIGNFWYWNMKAVHKQFLFAC